MKAGRPTKLNAALKAKALDYVENYAEFDHAIPSIVGMSVVLNIAKSTLYKWASEEGTGFSDILAKCNDHQEFVLIDKGLKNEVNPTIAKLALGKHGYSDNVKNEVTGSGGGPVEVITSDMPIEEASRLYREMLQSGN